MTEDQIEVDRAMEEFGGDRNRVAAVLGKARSTIDNYIAKIPELRFKWLNYSGSEPPGQAATLHRPPTNNGIKITDAEVSLVTNLSKEDAMLADGLEKLCLSPEEAALALHLQKFHQGHFVQSVQIIGASMTRICLRMATQQDQIAKRLDDVRAEIKKCAGAISRSCLVEEEAALMKSYIAIGDQIRRMSDTAHRGMTLQAMIRYRLSDSRREREKTMSKPGFQPYIPVDSTPSAPKENGNPNPQP